MACVIKVSGLIEELPDTELTTLQAAVGGYIEVIRVKHGWLVVDEEGQLKGYEPNIVATRIFNEAGRVGVIVGDAVLALPNEID